MITFDILSLFKNQLSINLVESSYFKKYFYVTQHPNSNFTCVSTLLLVPVKLIELLSPAGDP